MEKVAPQGPVKTRKSPLECGLRALRRIVGMEAGGIEQNTKVHVWRGFAPDRPGARTPKTPPFYAGCLPAIAPGFGVSLHTLNMSTGVKRGAFA